jgi:hypothetical protein
MKMPTMTQLCRRFSKVHPGYEAWLDRTESYPGFYRVYVQPTQPQLHLKIGAMRFATHALVDGTWYTFTTCRDFREWMDGVVLD